MDTVFYIKTKAQQSDSETVSKAKPLCTLTAKRSQKKTMDNFKSINDLQAGAKAQLSADTFSYLVGGSDDERTLARNTSAYQRYQIRPRRLVDVRTIDTSVTLYGRKGERL
jgi:hypothetical protein